jgi:flagellar biosynthetic protein FliR
MGALLNSIDIFLLVLTRMTGLFVVAPIFGKRNIPAYFKVALAFFMAIILVNTQNPGLTEKYSNLWGFGFLIAKELLVGITIGYVSYIIFTSIYVAGQLIDMQIGFGMVNVLDPLSNIQIPVTANFYYIISMMLFLLGNGHHILINALFDSFKIVPLGTAVFSDALMSDVLRIFGSIFSIGFRISAPVLATILVTDIALGIMAKAVPQLNVFVVGMPMKIIIGLLVMVLTFTTFVAIIEGLTGDVAKEMLRFLNDMRQVAK